MRGSSETSQINVISCSSATIDTDGSFRAGRWLRYREYGGSYNRFVACLQEGRPRAAQFIGPATEATRLRHDQHLKRDVVAYGRRHVGSLPQWQAEISVGRNDRCWLKAAVPSPRQPRQQYPQHRKSEPECRLVAPGEPLCCEIGPLKVGNLGQVSAVS